mmetsp:Transcript_24663/g.33909  ORF Transcript_24663/g.33909 Transcript_24663/m.33909 type:complete len:317 (+) Transcript_24663:350-1300(+)
MINYSLGGKEGSRPKGVLKVFHIPNHCTCSCTKFDIGGFGFISGPLHFIKFIIQEQISTIFSQPSLMSVLTSLVWGSRNKNDVIFVSHINNCQSIFVVVETDLVTMITRIRKRRRINNTLTIMGISIISITSSVNRFFFSNINNVKTTIAHVTSNHISVTSLFIQSNIVRFSKTIKVIISSQNSNFIFQFKVLLSSLFHKCGHIDDLHSMSIILRNNVCSVIVDFNVPPSSSLRTSSNSDFSAIKSGKITQDNRVQGISDIHKSCSISMSNNCKLSTIHSRTPNIAGVDTGSHGSPGNIRHQVNGTAAISSIMDTA